MRQILDFFFCSVVSIAQYYTACKGNKKLLTENYRYCGVTLPEIKKTSSHPCGNERTVTDYAVSLSHEEVNVRALVGGSLARTGADFNTTYRSYRTYRTYRTYRWLMALGPVRSPA